MLRPRLSFPLLLVVLLQGGAEAQPPSLRLQFPRPANTFFRDEAVRIPVFSTLSRRTVSYVVSDHERRVVRQGRFGVGVEQPVALDLRRLGTGWYRLVLQHSAGGLEECFCVIPRPYEDAGDYGLFGLCPNNGCTEENLAPAAQMGVRMVRQTIPWPQIQLRPEEWRMELLEQSYALGEKYGIQMLLLLGYTPGWAGEKPINYLDWWVENCAFTWHPKDPQQYARYLARVTGYAKGKAVWWPSARVRPEAGGPPAQRLAWADSWEMWNEADIMFYVGDWNRYLDLLRMSWAAGRRDTPEAEMIYGGSTGNFHAMGVTASGAGRYCFDYIALHTGGDLENALRVWYGGAQQIPWVVGAPRETVHTECYAQGRRGFVEFAEYQETPGELLRGYLTLKAWREAGFYRSGCLGGYLYETGMMAPGTAMLLRRPDGGLAPTPLYVAFACARQLLSDATEVGPVELGTGVTAHAFLKHGQVMLAAWADDGAEVRVDLEAGAVQVDALGQSHSLQGRPTCKKNVGAEPLVIVGARARYLGEALQARWRLLHDTAYGTTQTNPECSVWYAQPLGVDLVDLLGGAGGDDFGRRVAAAARGLGEGQAGSVEGLLSAQRHAYKLMQQVLGGSSVGEEVPPKAADALWRLARVSEWLGEIADDRSGLWGNAAVSATERLQLVRRVRQAEAQLRAHYGAAEAPVADQLLARAKRQQWRLEQYSRRGTYQAMLHKVWIAEQLLGVEKGVVLRVVPVVDFTTGRSLRKARLLEPGRQTLQVRVFNYLDRSVSGTLRLKLPPGWTAAQPEIRFSAGGGEASERQVVEVSVAEEPRPWEELWSFTMDGWIKVGLPATLNDRPLLEVEGQLDTGEVFSPMGYYVNAGRWLEDPMLQTASRRVEDRMEMQLALPAEVRRVQQEGVRLMMTGGGAAGSISRGL